MRIVFGMEMSKLKFENNRGYCLLLNGNMKRVLCSRGTTFGSIRARHRVAIGWCRGNHWGGKSLRMVVGPPCQYYRPSRLEDIMRNLGKNKHGSGAAAIDVGERIRCSSKSLRFVRGVLQLERQL
jgi:hypothetical protein